MFKMPKKNYLILSIIFAFLYYIGLEMHHNSIFADPVKSENQVQQEQNQENTEQQNINQQEQQTNTSETPRTTLWSLFEAGGPFMWPLLLASIIGLAIALERLFYFSFHKFTKKTYEQDILDSIEENGIKKAYEYIQANERYLISKILKEGLDVSNNDPENFIKGVERESTGYFAQAERGLAILAAVSNIAPLIGFLGTVSGMIAAFDAIANADSVNAKIVAAGIKEALITTATGLIVAIPTMAFFQYFQNKVNNFSAEIETVANHIYKELIRLNSKVANENHKDKSEKVQVS